MTEYDNIASKIGFHDAYEAVFGRSLYLQRSSMWSEHTRVGSFMEYIQKYRPEEYIRAITYMRVAL